MVLLALLGCSKNPTRPIVRVESPTAVVERFRNAWVQRDTVAFRSCLAPIFSYGSVCADSAGNAFFQIGPDLDSTLIAAARLFRLGSRSHPPAVSIDVRLDSVWVQTVPRDSIHEREVFGNASVVIRTPSDTLHFGGFTGFILLRGDASFATEPPDSTRWFILNWIEVVIHETPPSPAARSRAAWRAWQLMSERFNGGFRPAPLARTADSAECDSLLGTTWGHAILRYLD